MIKGKQSLEIPFCFKVTHIVDNACRTAVSESRCEGPRDTRILRIRTRISVEAFLESPRGIRAYRNSLQTI